MMGPTRWSNLEGSHELYNQGHMIEAAVAWFEATGERNFLDVAIRSADLMCRTFGPGDTQLKLTSGHQEVELALCKLYRVTGERKYLDLAKLNPDGVGKGTAEGTQWAEVTFRVKAPKAGTYELLRYNDYYGEIAVNDGAFTKADGPWRGQEKTPVALKAGENLIRYRTRGGSSGKWACGFSFRASTGLSL